jgi:hypothetical protein
VLTHTIDKLADEFVNANPGLAGGQREQFS